MSAAGFRRIADPQGKASHRRLYEHTQVAGETREELVRAAVPVLRAARLYRYVVSLTAARDWNNGTRSPQRKKVRSLAKSLPDISDEASFANCMQQLDEQLRGDEVPVAARPLEAVGRLSVKYGIPLKLSSPGHRPSIGSYMVDDLVSRVHDWFECRYGSRLHINLSPGKSLAVIRGDPFVIIAPLVLGRIRIVSDPFNLNWLGKENASSFIRDKPINALDCVDGMTVDFARSLSREELEKLRIDVSEAIGDFLDIQTFMGSELAKSGRADLEASVDFIVKAQPAYGMSRWSSLQACEKFLKACLSGKTSNFTPKDFGHDVNRLLREAERYGLAVIDRVPPTIFNFSAGVRYGEVQSTFEQAFQAHVVARRICASVSVSGRSVTPPGLRRM